MKSKTKVKIINNKNQAINLAFCYEGELVLEPVIAWQIETNVTHKNDVTKTPCHSSCYPITADGLQDGDPFFYDTENDQLTRFEQFICFGKNNAVEYFKKRNGEN